VNTHHSHN